MPIAAPKRPAHAGFPQAAGRARTVRHLRTWLLCGVAFVWATGAMADGGAGAAGDVRYGGIGGVDSVTGAGGDGTTPGLNASGGAGAGGGAGVIGGSGGFGVNRIVGGNPTSLPTAPGGAGGAAPGQSGTDGTSPTSTANGGSGGGGGGGGAHGFVGSLPASSASGGNGGNGGAGEPTNSNDGGGGGAGGYGAVLSGAPSAGAIGVDITGGRGGAGGYSAIGYGGNGGSGGIGLHATSMHLDLSGTTRGGNGGNGGNSGGSQGGHGAAGGSGIADTGSTFTNLGTVTGGAGGNGGNANTNSGVGGNGAAGGAGFIGSNSTFTNLGTLTGGNGGNGGNGGTVQVSGRAGAGAAGGAGFVGSMSTVVNHGTIAGGNGGAAGTARTAATAGVAGIGITGSNLTVLNSGTVAGGLSANGLTRANAISFTGGVNTLELWGGSTITGNVRAFSTADTLRLGGAADGTFDLSGIGPSSQYSGFGLYEKTGSGTWTLTGTTTQLTPWTLNGGTLSVSSEAGLGDTLGGLTFNGGALRVTGTSFASTARTISFGNAGGGFDIADAANTFTVSQALGGSGGLTKLGAGTLVLNGFNTYSGGTVVTAGVLQAGSADAIGSGALTLNGGTFKAGESFVNSFANAIAVNPAGGAIDVNGQVMTLSGNIADGSGPGGALAFINTHGDIGGIELSGNNSYSGPTSVGAGVTLIAASNGAFSPNSDMTLAATGALRLDGHSTTVRSLAGSGIVANASDTAAGKLTIDTPSGVAASFTGTVVDDESGGSGKALSLVKTGAGTQLITSTSTLSGPITIMNGRLSLNGSFASAAVIAEGGTLAGNFNAKSVQVGASAVISPGNSIGTITVAGDLVLAPGSTYAVEIAGNGTSDRIVVGGSATVAGSNVTITALDPQVSYQSGQRYTILTAAGGIIGSFTAPTTSSAFLDLAIDPKTGGVDVTIKVKGSDPATPLPAVFQSVAQTQNQFATALALNSLPQAGGTLALYNSLLLLDAASARGAFDLLSGEIHASARTALVEESSALRSASIDRLRSAFGAVGAMQMATMNYGFTADLAPSVKGPMPRLATERFAVWGQGYGSWGRNDSDRNAGKLTRSTGGFLLGADVGVFDTMRVGLLAGYSHGEFDAKGRLSSGESDNYHIGLYGGGQWGALGLRTGASYTWHDVDTSRTVAFAGFSNGLKSGYDAGTAQVFGELGYRIELGRVALEPFAGLAYVNLHTDGFSETGGAAALSGRSDDTSVGYSTLGLRASTSFALQGMDLTLRGGLAWRHAFGDVDPAATLAFAGSNAFSVAGVPIAKNAALVEAGLDLAISKSATLGLSYTGQLASDAQDHAFRANLSVRF